MDVLDTLRAFEQSNSVEVTLLAERKDWHGKMDLVWTARAWSGDPAQVGVKLLASVSLGCLESSLVTMEALCIRLLYQLDFKLAEKEFEDRSTKS